MERDIKLQGKGPCGLAYTCLSCLCMLGLLGTYLTYLGIYAFRNPDADNCWYIKGLDDVYADKYDALDAAHEAGLTRITLIDIHLRAVKWFTWGFWTIAAPLIGMPMLLMMCSFNEGLAQILMALQCCVCCVS